MDALPQIEVAPQVRRQASNSQLWYYAFRVLVAIVLLVVPQWLIVMAGGSDWFWALIWIPLYPYYYGELLTGSAATGLVVAFAIELLDVVLVMGFAFTSRRILSAIGLLIAGCVQGWLSMLVYRFMQMA